ncbi:MAG: hypothetical protein ACLGHO_06260 [Gammaproteobacteria bacterium]
MSTIRNYLVVAIALVVAPLWSAGCLADVVLARLSPDTRADAAAIEIKLKSGLIASPLAGKPQSGWIVQSGNSVAAKVRPPERIVELYSGDQNSATVLCRIAVRYYPQANRWQPLLQLVDEPAVVRTPDGWRPVMLATGAPLLIAQTSNDAPNSEGFRQTLQFGLTSGAVSIDAWRVH